jgi:precorrin-2 dehydrogenase / sirohydrochlorin ferrochelatase
MDLEERRNRGNYYPLFLNLKGKKCLVVGGGSIALRKATNLLEHGASVTVISPVACSGLKKLAETGRIYLMLKQFASGDISDSFLVIAATNQRRINLQIASESQSQRALVNVVDDAGLSDFIFPALLSRSDLTIAISTGGKSPALSRKLRDYLEQHLEKEYSTLIEIVAEIREEIKERKIHLSKEIWQDALDIETLISLLRNGQKEQAKSFLMMNLAVPAKDRKPDAD